MNTNQMNRFTKRLLASTPGSGGRDNVTSLLAEGIMRMNPQGVQRISSIASALRLIANLANAAADLASDPNFIAAASDTFHHDGEPAPWNAEAYDASEIAERFVTAQEVNR